MFTVRRAAVLGLILALPLVVGAGCGKKKAASNVPANTAPSANASLDTNAALNENRSTLPLTNANGNVNGNVNAAANANGNTNAVLSVVDSDGDGLTDLQESQYNANPFRADTDGDGFSDGVEVANGYDPTKLPAEDPKALEDLQPVPTPEPIAGPSLIPFTLAQAIRDIAVRREEGAVTLRKDMEREFDTANVVIEFSGGANNKKPTLAFDSTALLPGSFDQGKLWRVMSKITKGPHFITTADITASLGFYNVPTPPFLIDGRVDGGIEDRSARNVNTIAVEFATSGVYLLDVTVHLGTVSLAVENTNLIVDDRVFKSVDLIASRTVEADMAKGRHDITLTTTGITSWSLKVTRR